MSVREMRATLVVEQDPDYPGEGWWPDVRRSIENKLVGMPVIASTSDHDGDDLVAVDGDQLAWVVSAEVAYNPTTDRAFENLTAAEVQEVRLMERRRAQAATDLAGMDRDAWAMNGERFTCDEAELIAEFLRAWRDEETGDGFLRAHAAGDGDGDDHRLDGDGNLVAKNFDNEETIA